MGNIVSDVHGSRGYLNHVASKAIIRKTHLNLISEKNFKNKNLFSLCVKMMDINTNFENCLKDPISREKISNLDKQTFSKWHNTNVNEDYILFSSRCYINRFTFHSTSYLLRHSSNSYSVCFVHKKLEYYGEIIKFCQLDNEIYAFLNCFDEIDNYFFLFKDTLQSVFSKYVNENSFKRFFRIINKEMIKYMVINVKSIISMCILIDALVENKKITFATKIPYLNTHD